MKRLLDVCSVKVYGGAGRLVIQCRREGRHIPQQRAHLIDLVQVKTRVDAVGFMIHEIEQVAGGLGCCIEKLGRLYLWWWESQVLVDEVRVSAGVVLLFELRHEGLVKVEQVQILLHKGYNGHLLLNVIELTDAGVVSQRAWSGLDVDILVAKVFFRCSPCRSKYSLSFSFSIAAEI